MKRLLGKKSAPELDVIETEKPKERMKEGTARVPLTHRLGAKITAFILMLLMMALAVASVAGAVVLVDMELYITPEQEFREDVFSDLAEGVASEVLSNILNGREREAKDALHYKNAARITIVTEGKTDLNWSYVSTSSYDSLTGYESKWICFENGFYRYARDYDNKAGGEVVTVTVYLPKTLTMEDEFLFVDRLIGVAYALRYWIFAIAVAALGCAVGSFVFLMCASGRRKGFSEPQPGWGTWVPLDVLTFGAVCAVFSLLSIFDEAFYFQSALKSILVFGFCVLALLLLFVGWCMSFALRVKLGKWWKNTLVCKVCVLAKHVAQKTVELIRALLNQLPLVWKTAAVYLGIASVDAVVAFCSWAEFDNLMIWLFLKNIVLFPLILFVALMLRKLQAGARALAEGDLEQGVDTEHLLGDFKRSAEDLSRIGEGMTAAVEQRLRSERMKTELITNVSHDLKTPLTSIINFADLIGKEPAGSEKITEYAEVLHRQSERLKRLVDDLVEASRVSTGDVEMQLAPCELGVMLTQAAGEYGERLEQSRLRLVLRQPEETVRIMADGRRLSRVIDNLMGNICKYAQPDTRVYLTLEKRGESACVSFKNTSREELDLSEEELMERFVRGDRSRNSEGNGLGLSIARSLTQLLGGELELTVDGDLFKVVLVFPIIE